MLVGIYLFFVFMAAGFIQTVTGFGFAVVAAPLLALVIDVKDTVMLTMLTSAISMLFLLRAVRGHGSYSDVLPIIMASLAGAACGGYVMATASNDWVKLFIGVVLMLISIAMWMNYSLPIRHSRLTDGIIGSISGFLGTTTSINGPILVFYYLDSSENRAIFRAMLTRYFLVVDPATVLILYFTGTLKTGNLWLYTCEAVPALYLGFLLGEKLFHRINAETFKRIALTVVFGASVLFVWQVLSKHLH